MGDSLTVLLSLQATMISMAIRYPANRKHRCAVFFNFMVSAIGSKRERDGKGEMGTDVCCFRGAAGG